MKVVLSVNVSLTPSYSPKLMVYEKEAQRLLKSTFLNLLIDAGLITFSDKAGILSYEMSQTAGDTLCSLWVEGPDDGMRYTTTSRLLFMAISEMEDHNGWTSVEDVIDILYTNLELAQDRMVDSYQSTEA